MKFISVNTLYVHLNSFTRSLQGRSGKHAVCNGPLILLTRLTLLASFQHGRKPFAAHLHDFVRLIIYSQYLVVIPKSHLSGTVFEFIHKAEYNELRPNQTSSLAIAVNNE